MSVQSMTPFQKRLKQLMNEYVHFVYQISKDFPREELYGSVSQFRRASMSVILNYIEGFTRKRLKVQLNHYESSYGSLHESLYLFEFALEEQWINKDAYHRGITIGDEVGAMLWSEIQSTEQKINK